MLSMQKLSFPQKQTNYTMVFLSPFRGIPLRKIAHLAWIPAFVTPIGQGAFPMAISM